MTDASYTAIAFLGDMNHQAMFSERAFAVRLMEHLVVPTFVLDDQRRVIIWNRACERLTGLPAAAVIGTNDHWKGFYAEPRYCLADILSLGHIDELPELYASHTVHEDANLGLRAEIWCLMPLVGKRLYLAVDAGPIFDDHGRLIAVVETLRDMTDQKLAELALQSLAVKDGLTGIANRRSFDETFAAEWARAAIAHAPLSLLLADIDWFKNYNDAHGHQKGDECLKSVARLIEAHASRPNDLAARYGGEEFAVILPATDLSSAVQVAERIREAARGLHRSGAKSAAGSLGNDGITLSIGVATAVPSHRVTPESLVTAADRALYAAKHAGRNRVVSAISTLGSPK